VNGCYANELHKSFNALALCVEHRFYGKSNPGRDASTIKYLSVEQNLADTAAIVEIVQKKLGTPFRPVLNFGGSYSGATSAWFRDAYPNVTFAAFSSSGVVRALENFTGFDETVQIALGTTCSENLKRLTNVFVDLSKTTSKWNEAKRTMRASNLVNTHLGDDDFWYALADGAQMLDQYGHKASLCEFLSSTNDKEGMDLVSEYSDFIAKSWGNDFMGKFIITFHSLLYPLNSHTHTHIGGCFYDSECVRDETSTGMGRSWRWQKCSQLAYLQPGYHGSLRFENLTLDRLVKQCEYVFPGIYESHELSTIVREFNEKWGGDRPRGTRIFFSDFSDDPWRYVSVQDANLELEQPYCYLECDGCGHCGAGVPANLTKCSDQEMYWVKRWLDEYATMYP